MRRKNLISLFLFTIYSSTFYHKSVFDFLNQLTRKENPKLLQMVNFMEHYVLLFMFTPKYKEEIV